MILEYYREFRSVLASRVSRHNDDQVSPKAAARHDIDVRLACKIATEGWSIYRQFLLELKLLFALIVDRCSWNVFRNVSLVCEFPKCGCPYDCISKAEDK